MNNAKEFVSAHDLLSIIEDFIEKSTGLRVEKSEIDVTISQKGDSKEIKFKRLDINDVLLRKDAEGHDFVQVNLATGRKILLTDHLVGFKPFPIADLDINKLPRVVTTLDLLSVFEAIEETFSSHNGNSNEETETLKKVFQSILQGGEDVGFDLSTERSWLKRLPGVISRTSA